MITINEDTVEQPALDWLSGVGFAVVHGSTISPDGEAPFTVTEHGLIAGESTVWSIS
ncbi:hypothetical protein [Neorhodopirellula lusitana]|uniref:hypothetical protein n=1 Tax=Neorhodopirellula lusitana TaxID=445327 RepID=UPI0024B7A292|nr:hypothetical protein [Neorhodopirellula lusitana]